MIRTISVLDPGPLTTLQDRGRSGLAHLGVPRAGALDQPSADAANRLVGNDAGAAVLETTVGGLRFRADASLTLAVTGADSPVTVAGRSAAFGEALSVRAGEVVEIGVCRSGVRAYVGVAGGFAVEAVLGSRSTDTLAWVGPPRVAAGHVLPLGETVGEPSGATVLARRVDALRLRCTPGPRAAWFGQGLEGQFVVTADSNRVGLRLDGVPLRRRVGGELPSEGIVLGAVQVPSSGLPVVFLRDHPTTGGYPVVAVVEEADLAACAQARPGTPVRFHPR